MPGGSLEGAKVLPYSLEGLDDLLKKHPAKDPGAVPWTAGSDFELEGAEPLKVSFDSVVSLIRTSAKGTSPGIVNFQIDILKQLSKTLFKKDFPMDTRLFLALLTDFFNRAFTYGQCPRGVLNFYDAGELIRLRQGVSKIRGIGKATTYRKIFDVAQNKPHRAAQQEEFAGIQLCGAAFGTEWMQSAMNVHLQVNQSQTVSSSDGINAYGKADRSKILDGVQKVMPAALESIQLAAPADCSGGNLLRERARSRCYSSGSGANPRSSYQRPTVQPRHSTSEQGDSRHRASTGEHRRICLHR